jgi:hypothetical protein
MHTLLVSVGPPWKLITIMLRCTAHPSVHVQVLQHDRQGLSNFRVATADQTMQFGGGANLSVGDTLDAVPLDVSGTQASFTYKQWDSLCWRLSCWQTPRLSSRKKSGIATSLGLLRTFKFSTAPFATLYCGDVDTWAIETNEHILDRLEATNAHSPCKMTVVRKVVRIPKDSVTTNTRCRLVVAVGERVPH